MLKQMLRPLRDSGVKCCFRRSLLIFGLWIVHGAASSAPTTPPTWDGTLGGQQFAEFFATDIAVTPTGDIYYTDSAQKAVFRYKPDGTQDLKIPGFPSFVRGINIGPDGRIYVGANPTRDIQIFNESGKLVDTWKDVGDVNGEGFFGKDGLLYLADNNQVIALNAQGNVVKRFSGTGTGLGQHSSLGDIAVDSKGDIWTVNRNNPPRVQKFSSTGQVKLAFGSAGSGPGQFKSLVSIAVDSTDNIYVSDRRNYRIQKFDSKGKFIKAWGSEGTGPGQFYESHGIFVANDDTLWVAGFHAYSVQQFDTEGNLLTFLQGDIPSNAEFSQVTGLALLNDVTHNNVLHKKVLYAVDKQNNRVQALDPETGEVLFKFGRRGQGASTVFNFPRAIAAGPDKSLYISDDGHTRRIAPDGKFLDIYSYRAQTGGDMIGASGIAVADNGLLYQANESRSTMFTIDTKQPGGQLLSEWRGPASAPGRMINIRSAALAGNELYIADAGDRSIKAYSLFGDFLRVVTSQVPRAAGVAVVPRDNVIYAGSNGVVRAFDLSGKALFTFGSPGSGPGQFGTRISAIAVDEVGTVFAADTTQGRIHRFRYASSSDTPPAAPSNLTASGVSSTQVTLNWQDNSINERAFRVQRKLGTGTWGLAKRVGANVTTYTDTGLASGTNYSYRVQAVNAAGSSTFSNTVQVKTP
jgi:tripartite motif-containing protein 71